MSEDPPIFPDPKPTNHGRFEGPATEDDYLEAQKMDPRQVAKLRFQERSATSALSEKESERYDDNTGLLFGPHFRAEANKVLKDLNPHERRQLAPNNAVIMSFDGKGLKLVNDVLGHANGDIMLGNIAAILKAVARPGDVIGRLGDSSDEFGAIFFFRNDQIEPEEMKKAINERLLMLTQYAVKQNHVKGLRWSSTFFEPGNDIAYHLKKADPVESINPGMVIEYPSKEILPNRNEREAIAP